MPVPSAPPPTPRPCSKPRLESLAFLPGSSLSSVEPTRLPVLSLSVHKYISLRDAG